MQSIAATETCGNEMVSCPVNMEDEAKHISQDSTISVGWLKTYGVRTPLRSTDSGHFWQKALLS